jgi:hypothetical protein
MLGAKTPTKFHSIKSQGGWFKDIVWFDSRAEMSRAADLQIAFKQGTIANLQRQVRYRIDVNGEHICDYIADFVYTHWQYGEVVEDVKGHSTADFRLKKKLMKAVLGIDVKLVKA